MFPKQKQKEIYLKLGDLYVKKKFFCEALDAYYIALRKGAGKGQSKLIELGDFFMKQGHLLDMAIEAYEKAGDKAKIAEVGDWYFKKGNFLDAIKLYEKSGYKENLAKVGDEYLRRYFKAKQENPSSPGIISYLIAAAGVYKDIRDKEKLAEIGDLYLKEGMYPSAFEIYKEAGKKKLAEFIWKNYCKK